MNKLLDREQSIKDLIYLFEQRNFLSCKNKLNQLKVIFPNDYFLENFDGVINANDELYDNAIVLFKNSIKLNPTFIDPYLNISKIFEKKLKNSYMEKLDLYTDEKIVIKNSEKIKDSRIHLTTHLMKNNEVYEIIYKFYKTPSTDWLIYDVDILGVSIIQAYRTQFADALAKESFEKLMEKLKKD